MSDKDETFNLIDNIAQSAEIHTLAFLDGYFREEKGASLREVSRIPQFFIACAIYSICAMRDNMNLSQEDVKLMAQNAVDSAQDGFKDNFDVGKHTGRKDGIASLRANGEKVTIQ